MASFLVAYGTGDGQTAAVAERVATALAGREHVVTVVDIEADAAVSVDEFDAVVVGSPVRERHHLPAVVDFVRANRDALAARPSAFFQVSFVAVLRADWARNVAQRLVDDLVGATGWRPDRVGSFAGAVRYTQYDAFTRLAFTLVAAVTTGDTDTTRDYEYTDWEAVDAFAADLAALVERPRSDRPAPPDEPVPWQPDPVHDAAGGGRLRGRLGLGLLVVGLAVAVGGRLLARRCRAGE